MYILFMGYVEAILVNGWITQTSSTYLYLCFIILKRFRLLRKANKFTRVPYVDITRYEGGIYST